MRAVVLNEVPAAPVVSEVELPLPGAGELLVKVAVSSVNGFDAATAAGYLQGMMEHRFPLVVGKDFAGTVEVVGEGAEGFGPDAVEGLEVTAIPIMADTNAQTLVHLAEQAAAGAISVPVTAVYHLDQAPEAFAAFGTGALGKIAVTCG